MRSGGAMSDHPTSPLLGANEQDTLSQQPWNTSTGIEESSRSSAKKPSLRSADSDESTPLLARVDDEPYRDDPDAEDDDASIAAAASGSLEANQSSLKRSRWRWPITAALATLVALVIVILGLGFALPSAVEEYAQQAAVFEPTDLSIETFTDDGIRARIQGSFMLDGSRVSKKSVRDLGRAGTWIAGAVETKPTTVEVSLPEYDNIIIGTADIPKVVVSTRDGHVTHVDLLADVRPGKIEGLRPIALDWIEGRLGQLRVQGKANVGLKSGIFSLGSQSLIKTLTFAGTEIPSVPQYHIGKLNIHEIELPEIGKAISADVSIAAFNEYPVTFTIPPLAFEILVAGCSEDQQFIQLANATTQKVEVAPKHKVAVDARGTVRKISDTLLSSCPGSSSSPLDTLVGSYIHGDETTLFVRGADLPDKTPEWISDLTKSIMVPVPLSGRSMGKLIRNLTMNDVHVGMPDPLADSNSRAAQPSVSATIEVSVNIPEEMNLPIHVSRVRSKPDVFYKGEKLGVLDIDKWHPAKSERTDAPDDDSPVLVITTSLKDAPIWITDHKLFSTLIQNMIFGSEILLGIKAGVDVELATAVGEVVVRGVPAEGKIPIKPLPKSGDSYGKLFKIGDLNIIETTSTSIILGLQANLTNPTNYAATVPYVNVNVLSNGTVLAQASIKDIHLEPGLNDNIAVRVRWSPGTFSGENGTAQSRELLSQYLSNYNTTLAFQTHSGTFPSNPGIGSALSALEIEIPTPSLNGPDDGDSQGKKHFIQDATMHLLTSTATFKLLSPLQRTTIFVTYLNVTAYYNHTEPTAQIEYGLPIAIPPGLTETPRLPVDWSLDSVGYDAVKDALGGTLKLDSQAQVGLSIGEFRTHVWYEGKSIGAHVRL